MSEIVYNPIVLVTVASAGTIFSFSLTIGVATATLVF